MEEEEEGEEEEKEITKQNKMCGHPLKQNLIQC